MVEAAEQRKTADRRRTAVTLALAFNDPSKLDQVTPEPKELERRGPKAEFETEQWW